MGTIKKRLTAKGKAVYDASVRRHGYPRTYRTFDKLTDAKAWVQQMEVRVRAGVPTVTAEAERHTFAEAVDRYIREGHLEKLARADDQKRQIEWFAKHVASKPLAEVTPALITELKSLFLRELTPRNIQIARTYGGWQENS